VNCESVCWPATKFFTIYRFNITKEIEAKEGFNEHKKGKTEALPLLVNQLFSDYYQKMKKNLRQCDKKTESNQFLLTVGLMMQLFVLRQFAEWPIKLVWQKSIVGEINK
jgi:hypothetical protein